MKTKTRKNQYFSKEERTYQNNEIAKLSKKNPTVTVFSYSFFK